MLSDYSLEDLNALSAESLKQMLIDERVQERARKEEERKAEEAAKNEAMQRRTAFVLRMQNSGRLPKNKEEKV